MANAVTGSSENQPVPTGTATPWRVLANGEDDVRLWVRDDGWVVGPAGLLAEALRIEGLAASVGPALSLVDTAELSLGYLGLSDDGDGDEVLCGADGAVVGAASDCAAWSVRRCVVARFD